LSAAVRFRPVTPADHPVLAEFLVGEDWPFHHHRRLSAATVADWLATGAYALPQALAFCIEHDGRLLGLIHLDDIEDIDDGEPLLNIRLTAAARGQGVGRAAVRWICEHAFGRWPRLQRIAAETRTDNLAMRHVLRACGFAKEAHHRQAWTSADGTRHDCIGYALLRADWERGMVTPVECDDAG